jgi:hypothetical protein
MARQSSAVSYSPPDFCDACAAPLPWAARQALVYELQNRLDEEPLDPADELIVGEQLQALTDADLDEAEQVKRWQRVKALAPGLWKTAQPIIETLASAAIKSQLG